MIILTSGSWLRQNILKIARIDFNVIVADVDERAIEQQNSHLSDEKLVLLLAKSKVTQVQKQYPTDIIIGADTFAILPDGRRLHKPKNTNDAISLCLAQAGSTITVLTGLVIAKDDRILTHTTKTSITYQNFDEPTIRKLLKDDDPTVRNSGLGFFTDAPGFSLVASFNGSYTGAMGLPMEKVRESLIELNYMQD